jgi:hypothetical protein
MKIPTLNPPRYFLSACGSDTLVLLLMTTPWDRCLRSRFSLVAIAGLTLVVPLSALPLFASTASAFARHHHHAALRPAAASPCGRIAGHASHTVLTTPASVSCHSNAPPILSVQMRPTHLATQPVHTRAAIAPIARIHFVPPLRGSLESLTRQNQRDEAEGLVRIEDDAQLDQLETSGDIVPLSASSSLRVNPDLPANRRYARAWTARFLTDLARSHYARFHRALQVNSAVRTVEFQRSLIAINGNAAPADGDIASPHLTGAAVDIGKKDMSFSELSWMRAWLLPLQTAGKIDVEEEFYQSCFHVTVYSGYTPPTQIQPPPRMVAHRRHSTTTLLAAGVR